MMKFKSVCRCLTAWTLSMSMILSSSAFMVQAGNLSDDAAAVQAEAGDLSNVEIADFSDTETFSENDASGQISDGTESEGKAGGEDEQPPVDGEAGEDEQPPVNGESGEDEQPPVDGESGEDGPAISLEWAEDSYGICGDSNPAQIFMFPESEITLVLDGVQEGYQVNWEIHSYNEQDEDIPNEYVVMEVPGNDPTQCTLTGLTPSESSRSFLTVSVTDENGSKDSLAVYVEVRTPELEYEYDYDPNNKTMTVGDIRNLGAVHIYERNAEYPDGYWYDLPYIDAAVEPSDVVELHKTGDDDGCESVWIQALNYGTATVTLSHYSGVEEESVVEYEMEFVVGRDRYELEIQKPNPSNDCLRPGESMTIDTVMHHWWDRGNDESGYEQIADYRLEIVSSEEEQESWPLDVTIQDKTILVTAAEDAEDGDYEIQVKAKALDGEGEPTGEECTAGFWIRVRGEGFYVVNVDADEVEALRTLAPNASTTISPELIFRSEAGDTVSEGSVWSWSDWNEDVVEIKDADGHTLSQGDVGKAPFTITKLSNSYSDLCLHAMEEGEEGDCWEVANRWMGTEEQDYYTDFDISGDRWNGADTCIYADEDLTLTLNTENLAGVNYTVKWSVGHEGDDGRVLDSVSESSGFYSTEKDKIILHGDLLAKKYADTDDTRILITAEIAVNGIPIDQEPARVWVNVCNPYYEYYWPYGEPGERNMLPGEELHIDRIMDAYADDREHPFGENVQVEIKNVEVINHWVWDDEEGRDVKASEPVVEIIPDGDGWTIRAGEGSGWSQLELTCESLKPGEGTTTYSKENTDENGKNYFDVRVEGDKWTLKWNYPNGREFLEMGTEKTVTISSELTHFWEDTDGNVCEESINTYRLGELYFDTNWLENVEVQEDGKSVCITSKSREYAWERAIQLSVEIPCDEDGNYDEDGKYEDEGGYSDWVCDSNIYVDVCYFEIEPSELLTPEDRSYNVDNSGELDLNEFGLKIIKQVAGEEMTGDDYRIRVKYDSAAWSIKSGNGSDQLPVLIRNTADETTLTVVAERLNPYDGDTENWEEVANNEYTFAKVCDTHTWTMRNTPATCEEDGAIIKRCTVCGTEVRADVSALGHEWENVPGSGSSASCETGGTFTLRCTRCGAEETRTTPPNGHTWVTRTEPATCTESGVETRYCAVCGTVGSSVIIPATGHTWATETTAATCTQTGSTVTSCIVCGRILDSTVIPATGHTWGAWKTIQPATATTPEKQERECQICHAKETRDVSGSATPTPTPEVTPTPSPEVTPTPSPEATPTPVPETPADVTVKKAASSSYKSIKVTWEKAEGAEGYVVYRKTAGTGWKRIAKIAGSVLSFRDTDVVTGTKYRYTVRAYNTVNSKEVLSESYDKKGVVAQASLKKVTGLTAAASANHSNTVEWDSTPGATGYQIWCRVGNTGKFKRIASVRKGQSFVHKGLKAGTTYSYRVRAFRKVASKPAKYVYGTLNKAQTVTAK